MCPRLRPLRKRGRQSKCPWDTQTSRRQAHRPILTYLRPTHRWRSSAEARSTSGRLAVEREFNRLSAPASSAIRRRSRLHGSGWQPGLNLTVWRGTHRKRKRRRGDQIRGFLGYGASARQEPSRDKSGTGHRERWIYGQRRIYGSRICRERGRLLRRPVSQRSGLLFKPLCEPVGRKRRRPFKLGRLDRFGCAEK